MYVREATIRKFDLTIFLLNLFKIFNKLSLNLQLLTTYTSRMLLCTRIMLRPNDL